MFNLWLVTVLFVFAMAAAMLVDRSNGAREARAEEQRSCQVDLLERDKNEDIDQAIWNYVAEVAEADPEITRGLLDFIHERYIELDPPASCQAL